MDVCWSTVLFNVREASQELAGLVRELELVEGGREPAWRARGREMPRADRTFDANEKWPQGWAFGRYWPKRLQKRGRR